MGLFCTVYLDLNLFQTEVVYVLSVVETAEVNLFFFFFCSKLARISGRKCLKKIKMRGRGKLARKIITGWGIPSFVWEK